MKHVYTHDNMMVVNSAKNILEQHGIDSVIKNEIISSLQAQHGIHNAFLELWILNDQQFEKAAAIIDKEIQNPEVKAAWVCTSCNEENDGSFDVCWKCQTENQTSGEN